MQSNKKYQELNRKKMNIIRDFRNSKLYEDFKDKETRE